MEGLRPNRLILLHTFFDSFEEISLGHGGVKARPIKSPPHLFRQL
jgi:hypothetical protein